MNQHLRDTTATKAKFPMSLAVIGQFQIPLLNNQQIGRGFYDQ